MVLESQCSFTFDKSKRSSPVANAGSCVRGIHVICDVYWSRTWNEVSQAIVVCEGVPDNGHWCINVYSSKQPPSIVACRLDNYCHLSCPGMCLAASPGAMLTCGTHACQVLRLHQPRDLRELH